MIRPAQSGLHDCIPETRGGTPPKGGTGGPKMRLIGQNAIYKSDLRAPRGLQAVPF